MSETGQERDPLLDHDYDGIREYDNPLPKWWVWLFALTVFICFPYVLRYHFGVGRSIFDALEAEQAAHAGRLLATYGEIEADPATILRFMDDDLAMTGMASLFKGKCASCHLADGSGSVGPNLTDEAWINVKRLTDIPTVLTAGVPAKGMPAWGEKLTQTEIVLLSSYVARLRRAPVAGKAAQGQPIEPWPSAPPGAATEPPPPGRS